MKKINIKKVNTLVVPGWFLLFIVLALTGCGEDKTSRKSGDWLRDKGLDKVIATPTEDRGQDGAFRDYIVLFEELSGEAVDYPIVFMTDFERNFETKDTGGRCRRLTSGDREIIISRDEWNKLGDTGREQIMFHEMSHCRNRAVFHNEAMMEYRFNKHGYLTSVPASLMYPFLPILSYLRNRDYYIAELFGFDLPDINVELKPGCRDRTSREVTQELVAYGEEVCARDD